MSTVTEPERTVAVPSWFKRNEIPRKVLHGSIAIISTGLYLVGVQSYQVTPVLISGLIPIATLEFIRFHFPKFNQAYIRAVGPLMRESEKTGQAINGVIWYLVGLITVFSIFPKDVSFLSVFLLSWADLAASTVGRAYGRSTPKLVGNKSLAGSLAAFVAGVLCTLIIYEILLPLCVEYNPPSMIMYNESLSLISVYTLAIIMGLAAAISELFPVIDDNLSIPVVCAFVHWTSVKVTTMPYTYGVLA